MAENFKIIIKGIFQRHGLFHITSDNLQEHEITNDIQDIVFNNSSLLDISNCPKAKPLATLPVENNPLNVFATAIDRHNGFSGRVAIVADSGFIGDDDSGWPGDGYIEKGDNKRFLENILNWLKG